MAGDRLVTQMRKGSLEYCVLALLERGPSYGFELVQNLSGAGGILTTEGTIYRLLGRLYRDGLVSTTWQESPSGPPRKYYRMTGEGQRALKRFREEWASFRASVDRIVGTGEER
jgi:PadR family transcriptional regulator, regulatory protein PadR